MTLDIGKLRELHRAALDVTDESGERFATYAAYHQAVLDALPELLDLAEQGERWCACGCARKEHVGGDSKCTDGVFNEFEEWHPCPCEKFAPFDAGVAANERDALRRECDQARAEGVLLRAALGALFRVAMPPEKIGTLTSVGELVDTVAGTREAVQALRTELAAAKAALARVTTERDEAVVAHEVSLDLGQTARQERDEAKAECERLRESSGTRALLSAVRGSIAVEKQRDAYRAALAALVASLPKCDRVTSKPIAMCSLPATQTDIFEDDEHRCDSHVVNSDDFEEKSYAPALRAALELLKETT